MLAVYITVFYGIVFLLLFSSKVVTSRYTIFDKKVNP